MYIHLICTTCYYFFGTCNFVTCRRSLSSPAVTVDEVRSAGEARGVSACEREWTRLIDISDTRRGWFFYFIFIMPFLFNTYARDMVATSDTFYYRTIMLHNTICTRFRQRTVQQPSCGRFGTIRLDSCDVTTFAAASETA